MGRVGVDIYPLQIGFPLDRVETFGKFLGGSATNVAVAAQQYGNRSAVITRTGDDPFGRFIHQALRGYGVDNRYVSAVSRLPTPVTFCEIFPPDDFPLYFYRYPKAPDLEIHRDELDMEAIENAHILWVTGTGLSQEPSRTATLAAMEARPSTGITVLDLDFRPMFWPHPDEARTALQQALKKATVAVGNREECEVAVGYKDAAAAAAGLREFDLDLAVVKQGPKGVLAVDHKNTVEVPPVPVDVINGLGAGDAFGGALCHGLLAGWPTQYVMRFANAAGAIVAGQLACSDAMPSRAQVEAKLEETGL